MIDLMKRLAELDDKNPNVVKEDVDPTQVQALSQKLSSGEIDYDTFRNKLEELEYTDDSMRRGEMGLQGDDTPAGHRAWDREQQDWDDLDDHENDFGDDDFDESMSDLHDMGKRQVSECDDSEMSGSQTRASINMSAGTGEEVASMLDAIMKLAGVKPVDGADLGVEHDPVVMTPEPTMAVGAAIGDRDDMRSVLDRLNSTDDDEIVDIDTDEAMYDNTPASPQPKKAFNSNEFAHQENQPGQGNRMDGTMPKATFEDTLMAEYKKFVAEDDSGVKITHVKPNKGPKRPGLTLGSKHIGGKNGTGKRSAISGRRANVGKKTKPVVAVEGDDADHEINESLSPGEYHLWTVHFDDGTTGKIRITWDETSDEDIKAHYAKKGKTVVKIDYDWAVHGGDMPIATPEPYEKEKPRNPYATRTGPDTAFK